MQKAEFLGLLEELFEADAGTITSESVLKEVPGWSSLTFVGLIALIDEEFGLALAPSVILSCRTAGDLADQVAAGLQQRSAA